MNLMVPVVRLFLFCLLLIAGNHLSAQDAAFVHPGNASEWISPVLIESPYQLRMRHTQQFQQTSAHHYHYRHFSSVSWCLTKTNLRIGTSFYRENRNNLIFSNRYSMYFSKAIRLGRNFVWKHGLEISYFDRRMDYSRLSFGDQIDPSEGFTFPTGDVLRSGHVANMDFSYGTQFKWKDIVLNLAAYHLTEPNISLSTGNSPLPMRFAVHLGYDIYFNKYKHPFHYQPWFLTGDQGAFAWAQSGIQAFSDKYNFMLGWQYRSLTQKNGWIPTGLIASAGFNYNGARVRYGFRFLKGPSSDTQNFSHELSLGWDLISLRNNKKPHQDTHGLFQ